jgi:hypothetical protein
MLKVGTIVTIKPSESHKNPPYNGETGVIISINQGNIITFPYKVKFEDDDNKTMSYKEQEFIYIPDHPLVQALLEVIK